MAQTFSVTVRLQRVTTESAHVSVPLTRELFRANPDGTETIDVEKLFAAAVELGGHISTGWRTEGEIVITPHPMQTRPQ
jgi:hypothetical protein